MLLRVSEGQELPSSIAAMGQWSAVNELLLREGLELPSLDLVSTFHGAGRRESPARCTHALRLDSSDSSLGSPVDAVSNIGLVQLGDILLEVIEVEDRLESKEFLVLGISPGRELHLGMK